MCSRRGIEPSSFIDRIGDTSKRRALEIHLLLLLNHPVDRKVCMPRPRTSTQRKTTGTNKRRPRNPAAPRTNSRKTSGASKTRATRPATTSTRPAGTGTGALTCPDCGKSFTRAASLGAHRNRAHGIAGASAGARGRRGSSAGATPARGTARRRQERSPGSPSSASIDRDALLRALFPNGIPARESVIRELNAWLSEAERLAKQS
jgi:Zinc finger, C2H2 type